MQEHYSALFVCALLLLAPVVTFADEVGHDTSKGVEWAQTSAGRFTCESSPRTSNRQVLSLGGRVVFLLTEKQGDIEETGDLQQGILHEGVGCPPVLAANRGYVVITRDPQPPHYGAQEYLVIDFNKSPYRFFSLGTGMRPHDEKIPDEKRLRWSDKGLELNLIGYATAGECCTTKSAKPKSLRVFYDFSSRTASTAR